MDFELPESTGVIKGTKVYFCHLDSGQRGHYWTTDLVLLDLPIKVRSIMIKIKTLIQHRADLKNCGTTQNPENGLRSHKKKIFSFQETA